jgi:hypothetical protein
VDAKKKRDVASGDAIGHQQDRLPALRHASAHFVGTNCHLDRCPLLIR